MLRRLSSREAVTRMRFLAKYNQNDAMMKALAIYQNLDDAQKNSAVINSVLSICTKNTSTDCSQNALLINTMNEMIAFRRDRRCSFNPLLMIRCLRKHCHTDAVMIESTPCDLSAESLTTLMTLCAESGDIDTVCLLMDSLIKWNEPQKVIDLYHLFRGDSDHHFIFHGLCIRACAQTHDFETAQRIIDRIFDFNQINEYPLKFVTVLISFYGEIGDVATAQTLFDSVSVSDRDSVCIGAMMDALSRNGKYTECIAMFDELIRDSETDSISAVIYCIALNCYSHSGRPNDALSLFESIPSEHRLNPRIITAVIDAMARNGDGDHLDTAEVIYAEYAEDRETIHHRFKMNMLLSILSSCRRQCDISRGQRIYEKLKQIEAEHGMDDQVRSSMYALIGALRKDSRH